MAKAPNHITRQQGALAATALNAAATLNAYRPARNGFRSMASHAVAVVATEFPLHTLTGQLGLLALTARRATRPVRVVAWLVAGVSALGLWNFSRAGHRAGVPLKAALDSGLGTSRHTDSAGLWLRPARRHDTRVQAAVPFYGIYDFTRLKDAMHPMMLPLLERMVVKQARSTNPESYTAASPVTHVSADAPPFFVIHGHEDSLVPVEQARSFVARLRQVSRQTVVYAELPLTQHAFDVLGSARAAHAAIAVEQFLAEVYAASERLRNGQAS